MAEAGSPRPPVQNLPLILALSCALLALATLFVIELRGGIAPAAPVAASSAAPSSTAAVARPSRARHATRSQAPAIDGAGGTGSGPATSASVDGAAAVADDEGSGGAAPEIGDPAAPARPSPGDASAPPAVAVELAAGSLIALGNSRIQGVVRFTGTAPEMKMPSKRKDAEFCKREDVPANAVRVKNGKLADVLVRLAPGSIPGAFSPPKQHALVEQRGCMFVPRIQGVVAGQEIDIVNRDGTLHNVHTFKGAETWFNQAQPKGSPEISKELDQAMIVKLTCDVHPWMRGFVVVSDHPFFAVSGEDGRFAIDHLPAGRYTLEAWHSRYGWKKTTVSVAADTAVIVSFSYDGTEAEPPENRDELKGLF
jgi:plastocyanin